MAAISARRRALGLVIGLLVACPTAAYAETAAPTPPATPPSTAPAAPVGPAPFPMPMDTGPKMLAQAATAQRALKLLQPDLQRALKERNDLQKHWDRLTAQLVYLDDVRSQTIANLDAARDRLGKSAAQAYMSSGGGQLNAALGVVQGASDVLDLSRDMHLISTYGEHEIDVVEELDARKHALDDQILDVSHERTRAKYDLERATARVETVQKQVADAKKSLLVARTELNRFKLLATTAGSPIMGPNRLTAAQLAAFLENNGYKPHLTVTVDQLATYYIEEGAKVGIRGDVAFAQSILETGGFNFGGSMVEIPDNNFAGIGACDSCHRGFIFPDARTGVRAQMQLLRVYVDPTVTIDSLPDPLLLPRTLNLGFRGRVQSWWDLTGTWATAKDYGIRVYDLYMRMVQQSEAAAALARVAAANAKLPATAATAAPARPAVP